MKNRPHLPLRATPAFHDLPIKRKLLVVIMATTTAAMLLTGLSIVAADNILLRGYLQREFSTLARVIADNSTGALAFDDPDAAGQTLASLRVRPHVIFACIYRPDGTLLATYARRGSDSGCGTTQQANDYQFANSRFANQGVLLRRPVVLGARQIGTLVLLYDLGEIDERSRLFGTTVLAVLLGSGVLAFLLASRLQATIADPVALLARVSESVSQTRDYSIRARKVSGDETGVLVDAFNDMLSGIQSRDRELRNALISREEALGESRSTRDSLRTTLDSIGDAVISTDVNGYIVFSNRVAQTLLRCTDEEVAGRHLDEVFRIVSEITRKPVGSPVAASAGERPDGLSEPTILIACDDTEIPIEHIGAPIRDHEGHIRGTVVVFRDVTARRRSDATSRLLASIVESSEDAIIGQDLTGAIRSWNQGASRIFGYSSSEMVGCTSSAIAVPGVTDEIPEILERLKRGERIDQYNGRRRTKSGAIIDVAITVSPLYDSANQIVGASKIARDITAQVRAADQLAQLNTELKRSNENLARSNEDLERFAFVASHDLQEPLRMIAVYSQLLVRSFPEVPGGEALMFVDSILDGTRRVRGLLADLLAYTEIGGADVTACGIVDLNLVLDKVRLNLQQVIDDSGARITSSTLPVMRVVEGHFISLFQNLVGNAIKYRSELQPDIHISAERAAGRFRFAVADNGIGIEPQYHEKIFVAFKRLHGRKIPGTGIGLAICQRVVERYGGRIWVESQAGQGATFSFVLPEFPDLEATKYGKDC